MVAIEVFEVRVSPPVAYGIWDFETCYILEAMGTHAL